MTSLQTIVDLDRYPIDQLDLPAGETLVRHCRQMLAETGAAEQPCTLDELLDADEAFLASTVREVHPIATIDEHEYSAETPISRDLAEAVTARITTELAG